MTSGGGTPVAVVTGGGAGIGATVAEELGRTGWSVVTMDPLMSLDGSERLPEPEERAEPDHDQPDEEEHLRQADAPPDARPPPLGGRDQRGSFGLGARVAPADPERDHSVLQERVARR